MNDVGVTYIVGRRNSGKSTLLETILKRHKRLIVLTAVPRDFQKGFSQAATLVEVVKLARRGWNTRAGFRICYRPLETDMSRLPLCLSRLAELLRSMQVDYSLGHDPRKIKIAVDEANLFFPHHRPKGCDGFRWAVLQGRHWGLDIVAATQRPQLVAPDLRDNAEEWIVFPLGGDAALRATLDAVGSHHKPTIQALANHHFVRFRDGQTDPGQNPPLKN